MTAILTGAVAASFLVAGPAAGQMKKWNLASANPAVSLSGETSNHFVKLVKEKTGGTIDITPHFGAALGYKGRDQYSAVEDGAVTFASTAFDKIVGLAPIYELQSLPFLTPTIKETKAMFDAARPYYEKAFNGANQTLLIRRPVDAARDLGQEAHPQRRGPEGPEDAHLRRDRSEDVQARRRLPDPARVAGRGARSQHEYDRGGTDVG